MYFMALYVMHGFMCVIHTVYVHMLEEKELDVF